MIDKNDKSSIYDKPEWKSEAVTSKDFFDQCGYMVIKGYLPKPLALYFKNYLYFRSEIDDDMAGGDPDVPNCKCVYGDLAFDVLMEMSRNSIETYLGVSLISQYTYARIYYHPNELRQHIDRPECEYSASLCLGYDGEEIWPLNFIDRKGKSRSIKLESGDIVLYKGNELEHGRPPFEGKRQYQLFMHYVEKEGKYGDRIFDGRKNLGLRKIEPDSSSSIHETTLLNKMGI